MGACSTASLAVSVLLLSAGCGSDDSCPAGLIRQEGRCVSNPRADAGADAAVACSSGADVGVDCDDDADCRCGPCQLLADGRRTCSSPCSEAGTCLEGWTCGPNGLCECAPAPEACNGRDDDCDGVIDDEATDAQEWFADADGDGFGDPDETVVSCERPEGAADAAGDCDDSAEERYPGAPELCNGIDDDCDQGVPSDEDDRDADGVRGCAGDCAADDATRHPGADERCNGIDDDCDGAVVGEEDLDADGFRVCHGDCDDEDPARHPGVAESCNGLDDDCDGALPADEADADDDAVRICGGDCADDDATRHPGAAEACNGIDDDCDGLVPGGEADGDGDGSRICGGDCADDDATRHPGAVEACNGIDEDCDGAVPPDEADADDDGFRGCENDCRDDNPEVSPDQDGWFMSDRGDGSFDYNCDGEETMLRTGTQCVELLPGTCTEAEWCGGVNPACGTSAARGHCTADCSLECGSVARQSCH